MAKGHRWLFERREKDGTHRYYLRARVPKDLVEAIGRREIKRSLGTSDRREALELIDTHAAEVVELFAAARRRLPEARPAELTEADARRLAFLWFRDHDREIAEATFNDPGYTVEALEDTGYLLTTLLDGPDEVVEPLVQQAADSILIRSGFPSKPAPQPEGPIKRATEVRIADLDTESAAYRLLCDLVRRGLVEGARRQLKRLKGKPAVAVDPAFTEGAADAAPRGPALSRVLEGWTAERKPSRRTAREWGIAVRRFRELHGDLPVDAITKAHVREFKDALLKVPVVQTQALRKLPLPKLVAAAEGDGRPTLSPAAVGKQLAALKSLLSWAVTNGYTEHNVASGVTVAGAKVVAEKRVAYSPEDMRKIFDSTERFRETHPARFWLPRLAAYTGARLDELGQLTTADVRRKDGIDYISINADGEGKSLKTASAVRDVPLHPQLIACGFLDHVAARHSAGGGSLFPDLKPDSLGKLTGSFSKWFTRHRRSIGIDDPRKVFHSFRHAFKEACRDAGIGEEVHDALTGHSGGGVGRSYGQVTLKTKAEAVRRVDIGLALG